MDRQIELDGRRLLESVGGVVWVMGDEDLDWGGEIWGMEGNEVLSEYCCGCAHGC